VGSAVRLSLSPAIFRGFSGGLRRPLRYRALNLPAERLPAAIRSALDRPWIGWNVTRPHKVAVIEHLHELADSAKTTGAVNVVAFKDGKATGYNTDVKGFLAPMERRGLVPHGMRVVVLGAGGAARAVCRALRLAKAGELTILNRSPEKALKLAERFAGQGGGLSVKEVAGAVAKADLVVNATAVGMEASPQPLLPAGQRFKSGSWAYDLAYLPEETQFLKAASAGGARTIGGLDMLLAQAAETWRIWFDEEVPGHLLERVRNGLSQELGPQKRH